MGLGFEKDEKEAFKWLQKAAELGYADAQHSVGLFYEHGMGGLEVNYDAAINRYKKAANQNSMYGQYGLGMMYYEGKGVARNYETAANWFRKAAKQGHSGAKDMVNKLWRY